MTEPAVKPVKSTALYVAGFVLLVGGVVGAFVAKGAAERAAFQKELTATFSNLLTDVAPDYTAMWVCIVIAALGAVALIVRAASPGSKS